MIRRALLIGAPCRANAKMFLPGVSYNLDNYHRFLLSPTGGAWQEQEIVRFVEDPNRDGLLNVVRQVTADFVLVVFSGHGRTTPKGRPVLQLNPKQEVLLDDVIPNAARQLVIVDACRSFVGDANLSGFFGEDERHFPTNLRAADARRLFHQMLARSEPGRVVCFACQLGATSLDTASGGYFSSTLLDITDGWTRQPSSNNCLTIQGAFEYARRTIAAQPMPPQRPHIWDNLPRGQDWFPFAFRVPVTRL